jgi:hypothetical protein
LLIFCLHVGVGDVFGFKDQFKGLGVFFDTFANGHHDVSRLGGFCCFALLIDLLALVPLHFCNDRRWQYFL